MVLERAWHGRGVDKRVNDSKWTLRLFSPFATVSFTESAWASGEGPSCHGFCSLIGAPAVTSISALRFLQWAHHQVPRISPPIALSLGSHALLFLSRRQSLLTYSVSVGAFAPFGQLRFPSYSQEPPAMLTHCCLGRDPVCTFNKARTQPLP